MEPSFAESIYLFDASVFFYVERMPKPGHAIFFAAIPTRPGADAEASRGLHAMVR
jgi:hypothetical protein